LTAELDRVNLQQIPTPGNLPERFTGLARELCISQRKAWAETNCLQHLAGKGELKLRDVEFRGWDVDASMADGAPHEGASRWASGGGAFVVRDRGIIFPGLRLDGASETLLRGTLSFVQDSDLTLQTLIDDRPVSVRQNQVMC